MAQNEAHFNAQEIQTKALALGIDKCGIIKVDAMLGYGDKLQKRIDAIPHGEEIYGRFRHFADVKQVFPWAKSLVVVALNYGQYIVPENAKGRFAKAYLFDTRFNEDSPGHEKIFAFDAYLRSLNLQVAMDEHPGITAYRWAAEQASIGIMRQNNFLYTEDGGSYCRICVWAIDEELELICENTMKKCPPNCQKCIEACPTKSLFAPYTMNMMTCVSSVNASVRPLPDDTEICKQLGGWIYGCDVCQDVCPMNRKKLTETTVFPGVADLNNYMTPEAILAMSYEEIEQKFASKFFYIKEDNLWKWKVNALNAINNSYKPEYKPCLEQALQDKYEIVRNFAQKILNRNSPN